jgi:hypothetical protein
MELDIFLPKERVAFEYQGEHHYYDVYSMGQQIWQRKDRDNEKKAACVENGIALIEVPYWWDKKLPSLMATIHKSSVPHIPSEGDPISSHLAQKFPTGFAFDIL